MRIHGDVAPRGHLLGSALLVGVLILAGCGSRLDPAEVAGATGGTAPAGRTGAPVGGPVPGAADSIVDAGPAGTDAVDDPALPLDPSDRGDVPSVGTDPGSTSAPDPDGPAPPVDGPRPGGGAPAASCDGFTNGPGITDDAITIGNAADVSGPQPGIFEASQDAVRAYVAYFNSTSDICGRKLDLKTYDTRTDGVAEQQAYVAGCDEVFAMVGSMSAFDSSGAKATDDCGLPDLRTTGITPERIDCSTCFGALSSNPGEFQNSVPDFVLDNYGDAGQHAAMLYINIGAAPDSAKAQVAIFEKRGMHFDYVQGIDISEFNYTTYAQQLKDRGIEYVQMIGSDGTAVRLAQAMQQQGFRPAIFLNDPSVYKPDYVEAGGTAVEGTVVFLSIVPFEEADTNPELRLYEQWLDQVRPGTDPTFFGVFAWSAARLFVEQATALGGRLTRAALVDAIAEVDGWTSNGLHSPQRVGLKRVGECNRFLQLREGEWVPIGGTAYHCSGTTTIG